MKGIARRYFKNFCTSDVSEMKFSILRPGLNYQPSSDLKFSHFGDRVRYNTREYNRESDGYSPIFIFILLDDRPHSHQHPHVS